MQEVIVARLYLNTLLAERDSINKQVDLAVLNLVKEGNIILKSLIKPTNLTLEVSNKDGSIEIINRGFFSGILVRLKNGENFTYVGHKIECWFDFKDNLSLRTSAADVTIGEIESIQIVPFNGYPS